MINIPVEIEGDGDGRADVTGKADEVDEGLGVGDGVGDGVEDCVGDGAIEEEASANDPVTLDEYSIVLCCEPLPEVELPCPPRAPLVVPSSGALIEEVEPDPLAPSPTPTLLPLALDSPAADPLTALPVM